MATNEAQSFATQGGVGMNASVGDWYKYLFRGTGPTGFGASSTAAQVAANWDGKGYTAIVTGASTGLGFEHAKVLASRGAEVVVGVRTQARADATAASLRQAVPGATVSGIELDLSSLASVRSFAEKFLQTGKPLNILTLNAGVMATPFSQSADGYELQFATNHLGHFLLTTLLLDHMLASAQASGKEGRVVTLSSLAHVMFRSKDGIPYEKLSAQVYKGYEPWAAYGISKLCNILFTRELNQRLRGKPVVAVCCHPGGIYDTDLQRYSKFPKVFTSLLHYGTYPLWKSIPQGAATQTLLATAKKVVGGEYYSDCNIAQSSVQAHDAVLASQLWEFSEKAVAMAAAH